MGDFTGFTFGGRRSSDLGIIRVSGGDRYDEQLFPEIKDKTAEISGLDGQYYFGSDYDSRKISINIAFDSLTEPQFRELRQVFSTKRIRELIFDETPYKKYMAKVESPIELSYVCFDEPTKVLLPERDGVRVQSRENGEVIRERVTPYKLDRSQTQRIYKGEGQIDFICYYPFAKSVFKILPEEDTEWAVSSGLLTRTEYEDFDKYDTETNSIKIYNAGDLTTGFRLYLPPDATANNITLKYYLFDIDTNPAAVLKINPITLKDGDEGVIVDTNNELIIGVSDFSYTQSGDVMYTTTGNLYNEYVDSGYFFRFEPNDKNDGTILQIEGGAEGIDIFYDYLYF